MGEGKLCGGEAWNGWEDVGWGDGGTFFLFGGDLDFIFRRK